MFLSAKFSKLWFVLGLLMVTSVAFAIDLPKDTIIVEAESATQMDDGVIVIEMDDASGGKAIDSARDARAVHEIDIPKAGKWYVWIRVFFPDGSQDSYWIGMDDAEPNPHDADGGEGAIKIYSETGDSVNTTEQPFQIWYWDAAVGGAPSFFEVKTAGKHLLWSKGREAGSILDQILLTPDESFNGEEASQGEAVITAVDAKEKLAATWGHIKAR